MVKRKKKKRKLTKKTTITQADIMAGIRYPMPPPSKPMDTRRPPSKIHPARNPVDE